MRYHHCPDANGGKKAWLAAGGVVSDKAQNQTLPCVAVFSYTPTKEVRTSNLSIKVKSVPVFTHLGGKTNSNNSQVSDRNIR